MAVDTGLHTFPAPDEVEGFWAFDNHMTAPMTPLSADVICQTLCEGFTQAQSEYDTPIVVDGLYPNGFYYVNFHPHDDESVIADRMSRYPETLAAKVPGVGARWEFEWKPQVMETNIPLRTTDWTALSDAEIAEKLEWFVEQMRYQWYIHGNINYCLLSASAFTDYYDEVVQPTGTTESYQCLQGHRTKSVETNKGLWKLSRMVRADSNLRSMFDSIPPKDLMDGLEADENAADFMAAFKEFLAEFGWRSGGVYDMIAPTWMEDPTVPLASLAGYVDMDDGEDPEHHFTRSVAKREDLLAKGRAALVDDPEGLAKFNELYEAAQYNLPVTEDHAFWIDQTFVAVFRRFIGEVGNRLVASGATSNPEDVHFLPIDELRDALANGTNRDAEVAERRESWEAYCQISPPAVLGTPPPPPPADAPPEPFMEAVVVRLLGMVPPDENAEQNADELTGISGSVGTATGKARVVTTLGEASALEDGEILVCPMTLPPWVPLFSIAAAVVSDTGGVLSHCAIVAREMGIPAVVGTQTATTTIQTGQTITVDGDNGVVLLAPS